MDERQQTSDQLPEQTENAKQSAQMKLADLPILALDCQATGAGPTRGHLLEIGWVSACAKDAADPEALSAESELVHLPREVDIPPAVQRVTGLSKEGLEGAPSASDIWAKLLPIIEQIAAAGRLEKCPTVIHYARFEEPFLRHLHGMRVPNGHFPLRIICSHEIARRLLPGLPRKGLRAVSGFWGHSVPKLRRAGDHAIATAVIWHHLVQQLKTEHGIERLDQLTEWLRRISVKSRTQRVFPMNPEVRRNLPDEPGIYRMRRSNGDLLYIGKATSLKQRVNSYFRQKGVKAEHILEMLSQAVDLDVTLTGSAMEAALLESDEIKQFAPPYNVALQKADRKLVFFSSDLRKYTAKPDATHCIGPLPDGNLTAALTAFGDWHAKKPFLPGDELLVIGTAILGMPEAFGPPADCLAEGLALFHSHHLSGIRQPDPLRFLNGFGATLWQQHLAELKQARLEPAEEEKPEDVIEDDLETPEEPTWTPEAVVRGIERCVMYAAQLVRRARWLCLLSESTLAWEVRGSFGGGKNILVFEAGAVSQCMQLPKEQKTPAPPGCANRMPERQKHFDLTTYERLRVVTTELRRLVAEGRSLEVRLKTNAVLGHRHLARLLPWV